MDFLTRTHSIEKNCKRKNHHFSGPPSSHPLLPTSLAAAVSNEERQVRELELFFEKRLAYNGLFMLGSWLCKVLWEQFGQSCKAAAGTQPLLTLGTTTLLLAALVAIPPPLLLFPATLYYYTSLKRNVNP